MKIKYLLATMCAALVMTNCSQEDDVMNSHQGNVHTLQATIEGGSRSAVTDGGAFSWTTDDEISVWDGDSYETYTYSGTDNKFNGSATSISGYAVYPSGTHGSVTENALPKVNLKASYSHGSTNAIMLAKVEEGNNILSFKHLGGLMRFVVKNVPAAEGSFTFTANVGITGDFQVETVESANVINSTTASNDNESVSISYAAGDEGRTMTFYVPLPVGTYTGFTITLGGEEYVTTTAVNTIKRGTLLLMPTYNYSGSGLTKENGHTIVLEGNEEAEVEVASGKVVIDAAEASGASVTLNYTPEDAQPTLSLSDGSDENASSSAESAATVNVTVPANATVTKLDIDMPTMTVELNAENNSQVTYAEVIALTAKNTLKIGAGVKIVTLKIKGGNVRVANGNDITSIISEGELSENVYVVFEANKPTTNNANEKIIYLSANEAGLVVAEVSTLDALNDALGNAMIDKILLSGNIETSAPITIGRNVTIDLNGKTITANCKKAFEIHANATIKNGTIVSQQRCVDTRTNVELTLSGLTLKAETYYPAHGNQQPITIGGNTDGTKVTMDNVEIYAGTQGYGIISFVETELEATDCTISGYSALYVKDGSEQSKFSFTNSTLNGDLGNNDVEGNSFSTIAIQTDNVKVSVNGGSVNATGNYLCAISIGNTSDSSQTGNSVIVQNATIEGNILSIDSEILGTNDIVIPSTYSETIVYEGFGYETNDEIENTIKVKKAEN